MGITAEFIGGCTDVPIVMPDVLTAGPITGVLPRTTTALAPTTPRPTTTVGIMGGGSGGEALVFKRDSAGLYKQDRQPERPQGLHGPFPYQGPA